MSPYSFFVAVRKFVDQNQVRMHFCLQNLMTIWGFFCLFFSIKLKCGVEVSTTRAGLTTKPQYSQPFFAGIEVFIALKMVLPTLRRKIGNEK